MSRQRECRSYCQGGWRRGLRAFASRGWTTYFLMLWGAVVYGLMSWGGGSVLEVSQAQAVRWGALPHGLGQVQPWRYLTAVFVHFNLGHIGLNTFMLWSLGRATERGLGAARTLVVFLSTGAVGFVASELWEGPLRVLLLPAAAIPRPSVTGGASGGLFGLLGSSVGFRLAGRDPHWKAEAAFSVMAVVSIGVFMEDGINHAAHVGGLIAGAAIGCALRRCGARRHRAPDAN